MFCMYSAHTLGSFEAEIHAACVVHIHRQEHNACNIIHMWHLNVWGAVCVKSSVFSLLEISIS